MSHFTVLARVTADRLKKHNGDLDKAVEELMAPFIESGTGRCDRKYEEWQDQEDEYRKEYETESVEMVVLPDGELVYTWDERFKQNDERGVFSSKTVIPEGLERREVKHKDRYPTMEAFVADWHSDNGRDPEKGRYGYWDNPNGFWDYWRIGGRWRGVIPVKEGVPVELGELAWEHTFNGRTHTDKEGFADVAQIGHIDFEQVEKTIDKNINEWWEDWENKDGDQFSDCHQFLVAVGLRKTPCVNHAEIDEWFKKDNANPGSAGERPKAIWEDTPFTKDDLRTNYRWYWDPVRTYAVCDDNGWHQPGRMGWWCISDAEGDDYVAWGTGFRKRFIEDELISTTLVICDCHV